MDHGLPVAIKRLVGGDVRMQRVLPVHIGQDSEELFSMHLPNVEIKVELFVELAAARANKDCQVRLSHYFMHVAADFFRAVDCE